MRTRPILCTLYNIHDTYIHENLLFGDIQVFS